LMLEVGNLRGVCQVFRKYLKIIHQKNSPKDPNFINISAACGKVEQFIETLFPRPKTDEQVAQERLRVAAQETGQTTEEAADAKKEMFILMAVVLTTLAVISIIMIFAAWMMGARFDIALSELKKGNFKPPSPTPVIQQHEEL